MTPNNRNNLDEIEPEALIGRRVVDVFYVDYPGYGLVLDDGACIVFGVISSQPDQLRLVG